MLFSILIPVYNTEKYIAECIDSVLAQSVSDYEIILANDASCDNSLQICAEYQKRYPDKIRVINNSKNNGPLLTRRKLFEAACGDWIVCVDADDLLAADTLGILKNTVVNNDVDVVLYELICKHLDGAEERFNCNLEDGRIYSGEEKQEIYNRLLTSYTLNSMCTKAIRRNLIDFEQDYSKWSNLSSGEDLFQSFPIIDKAEKILYIDKALYCYRKTSGSISTSVKLNLYDMREILWEREDQYIEKWNISSDILQKKLTARINEIVLMIKAKQGIERKTFYKRIREDGKLKTYLNSMSGKGLRIRYKIICKAVLHELDIVADITIKCEQIVLQIKNRQQLK